MDVERFFSSAGNILTPKRTKSKSNLSPKMLENLPKINFNYKHIVICLVKKKYGVFLRCGAVFAVRVRCGAVREKNVGAVRCGAVRQKAGAVVH